MLNSSVCVCVCVCVCVSKALIPLVRSSSWSCNVLDALNVLNTLAVSPGISSDRCLFNSAVWKAAAMKLTTQITKPPSHFLQGIDFKVPLNFAHTNIMRGKIEGEPGTEPHPPVAFLIVV